MPITFHQMIANTASFSFDFMGEKITIQYFPGKVTEEFMGAVLAIQDMDESTLKATFQSFNQMLCEVISSWDVLEEENGAMYPLVPDRIIKLPWSFRLRVAMEIMGDLRPESIAPQA